MFMNRIVDKAMPEGENPGGRTPGFSGLDDRGWGTGIASAIRQRRGTIVEVSIG
jgi:hypothetical protein